MTARECFLEIAAAGTDSMYSFVEKALLEIESKGDGSIVGSHYSIRIEDGIIHATTRTRKLGLKEYSW